MTDEYTQGVVTAVDAHGAWVDAGGERLFCRVRGRLYEERGNQKRPIAPGDRVLLSHSSEGEGAVEEVLPRATKLSRPSGTHGEQEQVIAANIDLVVCVVSVKRPPLRPALIDRMIVAATNHGLEVVVVINKIDLGRARKVAEVRQTFEELGYRVFLTCAVQGDGVDEISGMLRDRISVFAGHSGVGKSSLLNAIDPELLLKVGAVSALTAKGRHTTTSAVLLPLPGGGYVVDTPGIRSFGLWDVDAADLDIFFTEYQPLIEQCRFYDCRHSHEPDCAVRRAVEAGELRESRYRAYLRILATLEEGRDGVAR